jgi:hypothetical protein
MVFNGRNSLYQKTLEFPTFVEGGRNGSAFTISDTAGTKDRKDSWCTPRAMIPLAKTELLSTRARRLHVLCIAYGLKKTDVSFTFTYVIELEPGLSGQTLPTSNISEIPKSTSIENVFAYMESNYSVSIPASIKHSERQRNRNSSEILNAFF